MRLGVMLEPQLGLSYDEQLAVARHAEALGFDALFRSDHYGADRGDAEPGSTDAWVVLAGLARETREIRLGVLVTPVTFRPPGNLAKVVATVAEMAGVANGQSRVELGLGTGWMESEHRAHGFPFDDLSTRFRRLEEQLQVLAGLWNPTKAPFAFEGEFAQLRDAYFTPVPDPRPRLILGGKGPTRTPRLAARYADEWNMIMQSPSAAARHRATLDEACAEQGRAPITLSLMTPGLVGHTEEEVRQRAARLVASLGSPRSPDDYLARLAEVGVVGTPDAVLARLDEYAEAGVNRIMLQHLLHDDHDMLDLLAAEVLPALAG